MIKKDTPSEIKNLKIFPTTETISSITNTSVVSTDCSFEFFFPFSPVEFPFPSPLFFVPRVFDEILFPKHRKEFE
jgi:hypothetical protein